MENKKNISAEQYAAFVKNSDAVYRFISLQNEYSNCQREYGTGVFLTMVEIHTLVAIEEQPGITITELAVQSRRTKGAISQIVKKLESRNYIFRKKMESDRKKCQLYVSEAGAFLSKMHKAYDVMTLRETLEELLQCCDMEQIEAFFEVIHAYIKILEMDLGEKGRQ